MNDQAKTNAELIEEISVLQKRIQELEYSEAECKRAEEALRENKERYRTLVENASDIVFRTDNSGYFTFVNPAGIRITGYEEQEIIGKHYPTWIHPDMRDEAMKFFGRQFVKGIQNTYLEYPLLTKEGHKLWCGQNTQLIFEDGHVVGFQAVARDITDRKRVEDALRESEERYRSLVENSNEAIYVVQDGMLKFVNRAGVEIVGYSEQEILSKPFIEFIHPDDRAMVGERYLKRLKGEGYESRYAFRSIAKNGNIKWLELGAALINFEGRPATMNLVTDITERKRAEEKLRQTLDSLRKAFGTTIRIMASAVETRDPYTAGHQTRSADLARAISMEMGLSQDRIDGIRMAGAIHDIGKLSIPAEILSKPAKLINIEFSLIQEHSRNGYEMLKDVESPWPLAEIVYQHHERMDGSGYPRNLKGDDILMEARIMAVADVVESMASHRPYRPALGVNAALEEIENHRGTLYDADAADACLILFREKGFQLEGA